MSRLVDPDGHVYVLQAHGGEFTLESLPKLGERMKKLPKGWKYRTRTLTKDLVLDLSPDQTIYDLAEAGSRSTKRDNTNQ